MEVSQIVALYKKMLQNDGELRRLKSQISSGDLAALQQYGIRAGQLSVDALQKGTADGIADQNSIIQILDGVFRENYQAVANAALTALKAANQAAGLGLNGSESDYVNTAVQFADKLSGYDDISEGLNSLTNDIVLQSQRYADDSERRSAEFASDSGLEVLVTREYDDVGVHTTDKGGGDVCQWCLDRCGTDVPYEEAYSMGMFERHPGCGCIITYKTKRGTYKQGKGDWQTNNWNTVQEQDERDKRVEINTSYAQNYRPVTRGQAETFKALNGDNIIATKVEGYGNDVYVSENVSIKPKALHNLNKATGTAADKFGIDENKKPTLLVAKSEEINGSLARYDAVNNVIAYSPEMGDRAKAISLQQGQAAGNDMYSTPFHEMYHCKQAQDYEAKHGKITADNYSEYIRELRAECKDKLDRLEITGQNVSEISKYAEDMYSLGKYDEVDAEYNTLMALKKVR